MCNILYKQSCPAKHLHNETWFILLYSLFSVVFIPAYTTYEDGTECSEKLAYKIQKQGIHRKERIEYSEQGENFK